MTNFLIKLKNWQIILLGVAALAVALLLMTFVAQWCYFAFPAAMGWILAAHIIVGGVVAWFIPGPFVDALVYKHEVARADAALAHIIEMLGEAFPEGEVAEVKKPDLDVFEPKADRG
jgi:hypothetical protein